MARLCSLQEQVAASLPQRDVCEKLRYTQIHTVGPQSQRVSLPSDVFVLFLCFFFKKVEACPMWGVVPTLTKTGCAIGIRLRLNPAIPHTAAGSSIHQFQQRGCVSAIHVSVFSKSTTFVLAPCSYTDCGTRRVTAAGREKREFQSKHVLINFLLKARSIGFERHVTEVTGPCVLTCSRPAKVGGVVCSRRGFSGFWGLLSLERAQWSAHLIRWPRRASCPW